MATLVSSPLDKPVKLLGLGLLFLVCFLTHKLCAQPPFKSVNLGGWLVIEGWIKPSLFDSIPNADLMDGTQIQLKSVTLGTYLSAEDGGGSKIAVDRNSASKWETFRIWRVNDGSYQLRVAHKQFIVAQNGGGGIVNAVTTKPDTWETFQIIRNPSNKNQVHIKVLNGMYMQAKSKDQLTADFQGEPEWDNNAATFEMTTIGRQLQGEYQLTNGLGSKAKEVLNEHWNTFITESDFEFLSQNGITAVRIPVGWWIAGDSNPPAPFVGGSLQALDKAFVWANKHNIQVIVDLHAAPGSQNSDEHSGTRDGHIEWDSDKSISVIDFLASRYANDNALLGIELLNEPHEPGVDKEKLISYYKNGYNTIRKYSLAYVVMCNRIGSNDSKELFEMNNGLTKIVVDVHYYNLFDDKFKDMSVQQNIEYVKNEGPQL